MSEIKIIGRRPNVSERLPKIGPNINCITANILANIPPKQQPQQLFFREAHLSLGLVKLVSLYQFQLNQELRLRL